MTLYSLFNMKVSDTMISVVIPSRATNLSLLKKIFSCLEKQTYKLFEVIVVCDREFKGDEWKEFLKQFNNELNISFFSHVNSDFIPHSQGGASYVRNYGINHANGEFIQLLDDDNEIDSSYLEKAFSFYKKFTKWYGKDVFITPSLYWRNTDRVQNQGFSGYKYWQARPQVHFLEGHQEYAEIKMFSGNGIFGKKSIMQSVGYDEEFAWIAEDLDFVYSIREKGYPILVFRDLIVHHWERDKTILEEAWIGNEGSACQKIKNIFLWGKKHANFQEKLILLLWSTWGICIWLTIKACYYGGDSKFSIVRGLWRGYFKGWGVFIGR